VHTLIGNLRGIELTDNGMTRAMVEVSPAKWHSVAEERLWVSRLGEDRIRIENIPMYARGLGYHDVVVASRGSQGLKVSSVVERGGHSTYRLLLLPGRTVAEFEALWSRIGVHGCCYEINVGH
jgi:hypothetical protein